MSLLYAVCGLTQPVEGLHWAEALWPRRALLLKSFHARGSSHRPGVEACLAVSEWGLHVAFRVKQDRGVICRQTQTNGPVCRDSCVELFLQPPGSALSSRGPGYFNFEANCAGTLHVSWVSEPVRRGQPEWCTLLAEDQIATIGVASSLAGRVIAEELPGPVDWSLAMHIPLQLIQTYTHRQARLTGKWRANLYKCADDSSLQHWASWAPIGVSLDFHKPMRFGTLVLP